MSEVKKRIPACECTHSMSAFVASLIPQPWMQDKKHCPAVRCKCGKQYYSFSMDEAFNSADEDANDH